MVLSSRVVSRSFQLRFAPFVAAALTACAPGSNAAAKPRAPRPPQAAPRAAAPVAITGATAERVKLAWDAAIGGKGRAVAASRSLGRVAVATGVEVELRDLQTGKPAERLRTCLDVLRGGLVFHGQELLVVCERSIERWDVRALKKKDAPELAPARVTAVSVAWPRVALGHDDGVVRVIDLDGRPAVDVRVPGPPIDVKSLGLTPDGARLAVAWVQGSIWWWKLAAPGDPVNLVRHESECDALTWSRDGARLAEEGKTSETSVWSFAAEPVVAASLRQGAWEKRLLFTADGGWLVRGGADGLELAEVEGPKRVVLDTQGQVEDAAFDERDLTLVAVDRAGRLTAWGVR